jgi:hypothetical protein
VPRDAIRFPRAPRKLDHRPVADPAKAPPRDALPTHVNQAAHLPYERLIVIIGRRQIENLNREASRASVVQGGKKLSHDLTRRSHLT